MAECHQKNNGSGFKRLTSAILSIIEYCIVVFFSYLDYGAVTAAGLTVYCH